ncbi:hypothetical protein EVAR_41142_1 [Eumeta japonica]|uniref:Uncharacterized protein n=1 Tax=Eumeta variegata TaxID=151549 RepID=A0A4C1YA64_EUMVA|nr:hypothetical protein EVAR_41142_1 [Eumeta japonica]
MTPICVSSTTRSRRKIGHSSRTCNTSWIFAGSQAQYGESFSLNLCRYCANPPYPVRVCVIWDVISIFRHPVRPFHSGKEAFGDFRLALAASLAAHVIFFAYDSGNLS